MWEDEDCSHLFQRVASFLRDRVVESLLDGEDSSHLFQRVASFLRVLDLIAGTFERLGFSSLSESGFIPTEKNAKVPDTKAIRFSSLSESGFIPTSWIRIRL